MKKSTLGWGAVGIIALGAIVGGDDDPNSTLAKPDENVKIQNEKILAQKYVNSDVLNIREKPNGKIIGKLNRGESVEIYEERVQWVNISNIASNPKWVSTKLLCEPVDCAVKKINETSVKPKNYQALSSNGNSTMKNETKTHYESDCSCSVVDYCVGPRGGHYCITSGGNKRYLPR